MNDKPTRYSVDLTVNGHAITSVLIGRHYLIKHSRYMDDQLILDLVTALDGQTFPVDSVTAGIEYFVADIEIEDKKVFRIIWLFEGDKLEVIGVVNAYRRSRK